MTVYFIACVCLIIFIYIGVPWIYGRFARLSLRAKAVNAKALVLTFDDGPGRKLTPGILKILGTYNVKATFFLLGKNIHRHPHIVRQIAAKGHEIGSHGYDHLHYWKVSPLRAIKDIKQGYKAINTVLSVNRGRYPFRPPNGKLNIFCLLYLLLHRVPIFFWSVDLGDTRACPHRLAGTDVLPSEKTGPAVLLAHDFDRLQDTVDIFILESVRQACATARSKGLRVLTCSQLLNYNGKD
ncbi:MAG TPA: polysaccharide deacetylase family protein [Sedimentisphaerales bacterium]|nr:polysaccharide deacetylase family protein [Sedimentisphaerales bacterium]